MNTIAIGEFPESTAQYKLKIARAIGSIVMSRFILKMAIFNIEENNATRMFFRYFIEVDLFLLYHNIYNMSIIIAGAYYIW